jgi:Uma2 family endonuclease
MGVPFRDPGPMTLEDFLAFTQTRPDDEKWELIDGEPVLNASPSYGHQKIVQNLAFALEAASRQPRRVWEVLPGLGLRLSDTQVPVPDVLVRPKTIIQGNYCDDVIVAFEVLSPSTTDRDLRWKRGAYAALPSLLNYVVIAQDKIEIVSFDRANGWQERRLGNPDDSLDLPAIGVSLPLAELYRGTGLLPT